MITSKLVKKINDEEMINYTIENDTCRLSILNYGGTIYEFAIKKDEEWINVVASLENIEDYLSEVNPYMNALIGPNAGRIAYGNYKIDDQTKKHSINNGLHHLHGGLQGIHCQFFDVNILSDESKEGIVLSLTICPKEDGYTSSFDYEIQYVLEESTLQIIYNCIPSEKESVNLTNHIYFNLSGNFHRSVEDEYLTLPSSKKAKIHQDNHPYMIQNIEKDGVFDFKNHRSLKEHFMLGSKEFDITLGYDAPFLLNEEGSINLEDKESKLGVEIITSCDSVVVYTANYFDSDMKLRGNVTGKPWCALALETQHMPNGINMKDVEHRFYDKEHPYHETTSYRLYHVKEE